jgi:hypothetical protein
MSCFAASAERGARVGALAVRQGSSSISWDDFLWGIFKIQDFGFLSVGDCHQRVSLFRWAFGLMVVKRA